MSGRVLFDGRVAWSVAIAAVMAMLALPDAALAQSGPANGPPPSLNRAGKAPAAADMSKRRPADLLDIRDRIDGAGTTVLVTPAAVGSILCVAGCEGTTAKVAAAPLQPTPYLAAMGPLEAAAQLPVKTAAVAPVAVPTAPVASANPSNVIICLAGCYDNDRRTLLATGGPLPTPALPSRFMVATAPVVNTKLAAAPAVTPVARAPAPKPLVATPAVKLKRTLTAHTLRRDARKKVATRHHKITDKAAPKQMLAAVGVPTPVAPVTPAAPKSPVAKAQPVVAHKKPVVVNTSNDWFNKITREQSAKKATEPAND